MCLITVLPSLRPGPEPRPVRRRRERMNSLTDLREVVDVVIGVDTHVHTHSAAVIDAATGGVLDEITVDATAEGYAELVEFANNHATLRAWAIEGTGGHGAGLSRHLLGISGVVIELDHPKRAARRNGAKSDPLDAIRAAREAMARPRLGLLAVVTNVKHRRCCWLLAAPRSMPPPRPSSRSSGAMIEMMTGSSPFYAERPWASGHRMTVRTPASSGSVDGPCWWS